ncbi:hypothetical protein BRADI_1g66921v3 [Brachypodium distachyon]|uniref:Uncharacterized protein n=1 Tax=Brachypodium distachyon TaxID=15368 RepID=A0A2K2DTR9_BRADI|nr:hypothetical protein BRADI_1g66921v3 [Brachypodium distachyon]
MVWYYTESKNPSDPSETAMVKVTTVESSSGDFSSTSSSPPDLRLPRDRRLCLRAAGGVPRCRVRVLGPWRRSARDRRSPFWMLLLCAALLLAVALAYGYLNDDVCTVATVAAVGARARQGACGDRKKQKGRAGLSCGTAGARALCSWIIRSSPMLSSTWDLSSWSIGRPLLSYSMFSQAVLQNYHSIPLSL